MLASANPKIREVGEALAPGHELLMTELLMTESLMTPPMQKAPCDSLNNKPSMIADKQRTPNTNKDNRREVQGKCSLNALSLNAKTATSVSQLESSLKAID